MEKTRKIQENFVQVLKRDDGISKDIMLINKKNVHEKEALIDIRKVIDSSPELRGRKALIETFIEGINDVDDMLSEWRSYVAEEKERASLHYPSGKSERGRD